MATSNQLRKRLPKTYLYAQEHGCVIERRRKHHVAICPDGSLVFLSGSPSDHRADANMLSLLRRHIKQGAAQHRAS